MNAMLAHIRWRLVGWSVLVLACILIVAGISIYLILARSLIYEVDRSLASQEDQLGDREHPARGGDLELEHAGFRGGAFYVLVGPNGQIVANPQLVDASAFARDARLRDGPVFLTVTVNGGLARIYARPVSSRTGPPSTLVVGRSLDPEAGTLSSVFHVLLIVGGGGLLLAIAGAWFLAGRALVPIHEAFRRQQEFVGDASHELRTPLTVLRSAHDLLNQHRSEPLAANSALLDDIRAEIGRMERLTDDLLTLARSDQGSLYLEVGDINLGALASDVVSLTSPLAREREITLALRREDGVPPVEGDPDRLQQALLILVDNALKHTPAGGSVTVSTKSHGGEVVVEVADTGVGIAPEHLPRLFDRFYRADRARSRDQGGTGLGLAIAKSLVEAHGGHLLLTSTVGVGTTASIRLSSSPLRPTLVGRFRRLAGRVADLR